MSSEFRRVRPGRSGAMRMSTRVSRFLLSAVACFAAAVTTTQVPSPESLAHAEVLRAKALAGSNAMAIVTSLTTEVGPRLAGSEAEARARMWALNILNEKGFSNVRNEPFEINAWERREEGAEIVAPYPQPLAVTALGGSVATDENGLSAEVALFETLEDLKREPEGSLSGRIAYGTCHATNSGRFVVWVL